MSPDKEKEHLLKENDDYSVAENHEVGIMNVFLLNTHALFRKRFFMYKRSFKTFIVEILIPILLVILGLSFSKITFFFNSPERILSTGYYPPKQALTVNADLVRKGNFDISP